MLPWRPPLFLTKVGVLSLPPLSLAPDSLPTYVLDRIPSFRVLRFPPNATRVIVRLLI